MKNGLYDTVIIGAGLAGLSCAYELCAAGKSVLVIEKHPFAGGRTSSFVDNGMAVESGLHRYIGYYSALPRLLKKCGGDINDAVTWEEKVDILVKDENKKLVLGVAPLYAPIKTLRGLAGNTDVLSVRDKLSLVPFFAGGMLSYLAGDRLDRYSVTEYAQRRRVTDRAQRVMLEPLSSGIFFLPPENYSAYAFFGLFVPAIPKFYKMRIGAFVGGMSDVLCHPIVEKIQSLGGRFLFGQKAEELLASNGRITGVRTQDGRQYYAKNTVVAVPINEAKRLLCGIKGGEELKKLSRLPCMSACTLQIELDRPALKKDVTTFGPGTDMVSFAEQSHSTFQRTRGRLSVIMGNPKEHCQMTAEELLPIVTAQLERLGVHIRGHVLNVRKVAEEDEFYYLGKGCQKLRPRQKTDVRGLVLAGDYTLTSSFATMEGAVLSGQKAAKVCLLQ